MIPATTMNQLIQCAAPSGLAVSITAPTEINNNAGKISPVPNTLCAAGVISALPLSAGFVEDTLSLQLLQLRELLHQLFQPRPVERDRDLRLIALSFALI